MFKAFVCINTPHCSADVVEDLRAIRGVSEVHASKGLYDVVALIEADSIGDLKERVLHDIRNVDNVQSTLTLQMFEPEQKTQL